MSSPRVHLVTGAARGIGAALVKELAKDPNSVVYAGVRSVEAFAAGLEKLSEGAVGTIKPIAITSADEASTKAAAELIKKEHGYVDLVIANAGISKDTVFDIANSPVAAFQEHFTVNAIGPLMLLQSFQPLLAAHKGSKFIIVSSGSGSIGLTGQFPIIMPAYAISKATTNMITRIAHTQSEADGLVVFPVHPGVVTTDMMAEVSQSITLTPELQQMYATMSITPEQSAASLVSLIKGATRESHGGRFWSYDGAEVPW